MVDDFSSDLCASLDSRMDAIVCDCDGCRAFTPEAPQDTECEPCVERSKVR